MRNITMNITHQTKQKKNKIKKARERKSSFPVGSKSSYVFVEYASINKRVLSNVCLGVCVRERESGDDGCKTPKEEK